MSVLAVLLVLVALVCKCDAFTRRFTSHLRIHTPLHAKKSYQVTVQHNGKDTIIQVREDVPILMAALDAGIDLPHDCDLGVCLTCPSKIISGVVDQTGGTLDQSVQDKVSRTPPRTLINQPP